MQDFTLPREEGDQLLNLKSHPEKAASLPWATLFTGFGDREKAFLRFKAVRSSTAGLIRYLFYALLVATIFKNINVSGVFEWAPCVHAFLFYGPSFLVPYALRMPEMVELLHAFFALANAALQYMYSVGWSMTATHVVMVTSDGVIFFWILTIVMCQMRTPAVILTRAAMFFAHAQVLLSLQLKHAWMRAGFMTLISGGIGVAFDIYQRKAFLIMVPDSSENPDALLPAEAEEEKLFDETDFLVSRELSDISIVTDSSVDPFEGLNDDSISYTRTESDEDADAPSVCTPDEAVFRCLQSVEAAHALVGPTNRVTVNIYVRGLSPDAVAEGSIERLKEKLPERAPGCQLWSCAVRKGSLMVALDVIYTGTAPCSEGVDSLLCQRVSPQDWLAWLELPWPQDGEEVMIQVGRSCVVGMRWDECKLKWISSSKSSLSVPMNSVIIDLDNQVVVAPCGKSSSLEVAMHLCRGTYPSHKESGAAFAVAEVELECTGMLRDSYSLSTDVTSPVLRVRYCGRAVPVQLESAGDDNDCDDSASELCSDFLSKAEIGSCDSPQFQTLGISEVLHRVALRQEKTHRWTAKMDLGAVLQGAEVSPGIMMLEVWHGRLMSQSVPILVLPSIHMEMAHELSTYVNTQATKQSGGEMPTSFLGGEASSILAQFGIWMEYIQRVKQADGVACSPELQRYMAVAGCGLLELSVAKGWLFAATVLMKGLMRECNMTYRELAWGSNSSGNTLLHLAALSAKAYMVAAVIKWGLENDSAWDWGVENCDGVTPLHIVAAHPENSKLPASLLKHFKSARTAWRNCKGSVGYTPKDIDALLGRSCTAPKKSAAKSPSSCVVGLPVPNQLKDSRPAVPSRFSNLRTDESASMRLLEELSAADTHEKLVAVAESLSDKGLIKMQNMGTEETLDEQGDGGISFLGVKGLDSHSERVPNAKKAPSSPAHTERKHVPTSSSAPASATKAGPKSEEPSLPQGEELSSPEGEKPSAPTGGALKKSFSGFMKSISELVFTRKHA